MMGVSLCAGVSWLSVTFSFTAQLNKRLVGIYSAGKHSSSVKRGDFDAFIFGNETNQCELLGWESSSCTQPGKLCDAA